MHRSIPAALAAATLFASAAPAVAQTTSFRGFRAEAQVGYDRFQSQGTHDDSLGYGGAVGFDGTLGDRIVVGAEGSFWNGRGENVTPGTIGGTVNNKSFEQWGAAVRAGYLVTPQLLVYGKGGYVNNEQRKSFIAPASQRSFYDHYRTDGYQLGGGVEYSLTDNLYGNVEYRYSNYQNHTSRQAVLAGVGFRFKGM